jgi:hypothetical protein
MSAKDQAKFGETSKSHDALQMLRIEPGGGVPAVAVSGRNVIQIICKRDGKVFETATP